MQSMMRLYAAALLIWLVAVPASAQFNAVGSLQFPTSTPSAEAQNHFLRGVAILHSFGWKQAIEEFQAAQKLTLISCWPTGLKHSVITIPSLVGRRLTRTIRERFLRDWDRREKRGFPRHRRTESGAS